MKLLMLSPKQVRNLLPTAKDARTSLAHKLWQFTVLAAYMFV